MSPLKCQEYQPRQNAKPRNSGCLWKYDYLNQSSQRSLDNWFFKNIWIPQNTLKSGKIWQNCAKSTHHPWMAWSVLDIISPLHIPCKLVLLHLTWNIPSSLPLTSSNLGGCQQSVRDDAFLPIQAKQSSNLAPSFTNPKWTEITTYKWNEVDINEIGPSPYYPHLMDIWLSRSFNSLGKIWKLQCP